MAIDVAALRAKALANKAALARVEAEKTEATNEQSHRTDLAVVNPASTCLSPFDSRSVAATSTASDRSDSGIGDSVDLTPQQFNVVEKIEQIRDRLGKQDPLLPQLCKQVHTALHKDPELVHFLKPEQIGAIVKACMEVTKVVVLTAAVKKTTTTASGKKLGNLTLADI